jgi:UDP-3-O-[3-hydroxymyristoyl] glucosamine N-acyltransferase
VTEWIRRVANLEGCLQQYVLLYEEVIAEGPAEPPRRAHSPLEGALEYAASLERRLRLLQAPIMSVALPPTISAEVQLRVLGQPPRVPPGAMFGVDVVVSNQSNETLASLPPCPVRLSYHWICPDDRSRDVVEGVRTLLSRPLYPEASLTERMTVEAPDTPGSYVLRVTLVQESVFWFDELTPPVASWLMVTVADDTVGDAPESPTMTLSGLAASLSGSLSDVAVARDGRFADLGFVGDRSEWLLTFAASESFVKRAVANPGVSCIVTTNELVDLIPSNLGVLTATNPKEAFFRLHNWMASSTNFSADGRPTTVAASACVHPSAWIDPRGVSIGDNCLIGPNVVINGPATIGSDTAIDAGAVIGSTAFQTSARTGPYVELEHVGRIEIGSNCHIYSNASIARGVFRTPTKIGDRCQIGNGAFVSHQCQLGSNVFVGHNATLNGRVLVGDEVWIGPGAVVSNDLTIGTRAHIALGSTVMHAVPENGRVAGIPALEQQTMFRHAATLRSRRR